MHIARSPSMKHVTLQMTTRRARVLGVVLAVTGTAAFTISRDEGFQRAISFNSVAIGPLLKYKYYEWKTRDWPQEKRDELFHELHERYAPVALETILRLKGFYIKLGQVIAGLDDLFPKEYTERFKVVQNSCPYRPLQDCIGIIEQELGKPVDEIFLSIDPIPIGSASIGQVHKARLRSTGEDVVVKIQHPDAERFFHVDVAATRAMTRIAQPEQLPIFDEIEKQFPYEFNYELEAENLRAVGEIAAKFSSDIVVPKPLMATRKVLVMTFVPGQTLQKQQRDIVKALAEREHKTEKEIEAEFKAKMESGDLPRPPSHAMLMAYSTAVKTRDYIRNGFAWHYNTLIGNWTGARIQYEWTKPVMDAEKALTLLFQFFGYSVFGAGVFSSDPHGGNVMSVDGSKLGLIDMGQVKRLNREAQLKLARLVCALADDDDGPESTKRIAELWRDCGYKTKYGRDQPTADIARVAFDRMTEELQQRYGGVAIMLKNLNDADPQVNAPDEYVMPMRAALLIRMDALGMGYGGTKKTTKFARVAPLWAPYARQLLKEEEEKAKKI